jgi:FdhD protein
LHAAAIFNLDGERLVLREDVGRHNAVDKVLGWAFLENKFPLESAILLVSGRASFEIMQKALAGRIPIVCAISAPQAWRSVRARSNPGGFLRGNTMNAIRRPNGFLSRLGEQYAAA